MNITTIVLIVLILLLRFVYPRVRARNWMTYDELRELMNTKGKHLLLDVRTRQEHKSGHIPGARCIPHDNLWKSPPKVNKNSLIVVYCRSGQRAGRGKKVLEFSGYTNVKMFGGISRWKGELQSS